MKFKKKISLKKARILSEKFCNDFNLPYCEIYFVDRIEDAYGIYIRLEPEHILIKEHVVNRIGILVHELTHHLEHIQYDLDINQHGYPYQLAKKRVIKWAKEWISSKPDWRIPLKGIIIIEENVKFKL